MRRERPPPQDALFPAGTTYITVRCWQCKRETELRPGQLAAGISEVDFGRRAVCSGCGANWPQITRFPPKASVWERVR